MGDSLASMGAFRKLIARTLPHLNAWSARGANKGVLHTYTLGSAMQNPNPLIEQAFKLFHPSLPENAKNQNSPSEWICLSDGLCLLIQK